MSPTPTGHPPQNLRNPYIINFCRVLAERKGETMGPEALRVHLDSMYRLFECMLGQNMINNLPEAMRKEYLGLTEDLEKLDYDKIGEIFDANVPNYEQVMKATMKEFAEIYMTNRTFDPNDYPVPKGACQVPEA